jgi:hypothetical protein
VVGEDIAWVLSLSPGGGEVLEETVGGWAREKNPTRKTAPKAIHRRNILHYNVMPCNILTHLSGRIAAVDFKQSKILGGARRDEQSIARRR